MSIENMLRKGLMWKSRIKWICIGFMFGFIVGSFSWGWDAHAEEVSCGGDGTVYCSGWTDEGACVGGGYVCQWTGTECVDTDPSFCVALTVPQCVTAMTNYDTCSLFSVDSSSTTISVDTTEIRNGLFGLNVSAALHTFLIVMGGFIFFLGFRKS